MLATAKDVGHIPIIRSSRRWRVFTALNVLRIRESLAPPNVRTDRRTAYDTHASRDILPASAADLVADDAADRAANDGARNSDAGTLIDKCGLDPAKLLRRSDHRTYIRDLRFIKPFVIATTVFGESR